MKHIRHLIHICHAQQATLLKTSDIGVELMNDIAALMDGRLGRGFARGTDLTPSAPQAKTLRTPT